MECCKDLELLKQLWKSKRLFYWEKGVEEIRKKLKEVLKDRGALVIITSHNKKDIEFLCDEVIVLQNRTLEKISKLG